MLSIKRGFSKLLRINEISKTSKVGEPLSVKGWVKNVRRMKNNIFLDINDGSSSSKFQVIVAKNELTKDIQSGCSIFANGTLQIAPNGNFELNADDVNVIGHGNITTGYPFAPKQKLPPEYAREYLHLRSRVDYVAAQMRVRHRAQKAIHDFMDNEGFVQIDTPIMSTNDCEGAGETFTVRPDSLVLLKEMSRPDIPFEQSYFDEKVFLSVSGQLHLEAMSYGLGNTYTLSPAFRAENCKSPLHLAEFFMLEAELAFVDELSALTQFIEKMIKTITTQILNKSEDDLIHCQRQTQYDTNTLKLLQNNWTTLTYDEALKIIMNKKDQFKTAITPNQGFSKEQELFLVSHCNTPVFVVNWPKAIKPFYMKTMRNNDDVVEALDLLMPTVGELCGGSLRESDAQRLAQNPDLPKGLEWYVELRKFGGIPTGGFGMGFERYLQLITGVKNIRDVIPFPRYPHSCKL
ncbi:probable asparagine--tRNA ligase, mitochondrial [Teleopsis dalmanni]|uniref:probable asparagine--tRNA ligase, mitochondrial n=1 Tax=Teleopsis dalmanni TaxID=139649 RepID=UPI0018CFB204|nr:probable asparagine--tRNA ligase, mitochondrial [Teleopsis dalmanni]